MIAHKKTTGYEKEQPFLRKKDLRKEKKDEKRKERKRYKRERVSLRIKGQRVDPFSP